MAALVRVLMIIVGILQGLGIGAFFLSLLVTAMNLGDGTPQVAVIVGAVGGAFVGYWFGKLAGDFAVVWIEWAAQMLAASDGIVAELGRRSP